MKNRILTSILFTLWLLAFVCAGCSGVYLRTENGKGEIRTVSGFSILTDRNIQELELKDIGKLKGSESEQSKALDVAKAALDAIPK